MNIFIGLICFPCFDVGHGRTSGHCAPSRWIGYAAKRRRNVDSLRHWTMINKSPFLNKGTACMLQMYAHVGGRPLRVGIYRKNTGNKFKLVQQIQFNRVRAGLNKVSEMCNVCFTFVRTLDYSF